jgi:glucosamine--fructose-6-phosphate aminotransferase (isomerizing)
MTERSCAILLTEDAAQQAEAERAAEAMRRRGCRLIAWPLRRGTAGLAPPWDLLAAILPFQWLGVALAEARGLRPEAMRHGALSADLAIKLRDEP